jgi:hypothetical protein
MRGTCKMPLDIMWTADATAICVQRRMVGDINSKEPLEIRDLPGDGKKGVSSGGWLVTVSAKDRDGNQKMAKKRGWRSKWNRRFRLVFHIYVARPKMGSC